MAKPIGLDLLKIRQERDSKNAELFAKNSPGTIVAGALDQHNANTAQSRRGRRPSGQEMALDGLTSGLSTGLKIAQSSEFVKKLQAIDASLTERLSYYENKEKQKQEAEPFVLPAMEVMNSDMPYEQANPILQQQFSSAQANGVPGLEGFSYAGFIPNSGVMLGTKDGKTVPIDISRFIEPDVAKGIISNGISMGTLKTRQQHSQIEAEKWAAEQDPNSPQAKQAAARGKQIDYYTDPKQRAHTAGLEARARKNADKVMEFEDKLHIADASVANLTEIMNVMQQSGLQGSSVVKEISRYMAKKTGETYDIDSVKMLLQSEFASLSDVVGPGVKSDSDMKRFDETLTRLETHPEAATKMLKARINLAQNKANEYRKKLELYADDPAANLNSTVNYSSGIYGEPKQQGNISPENPLTLTPDEQQALGKAQMPQQQQDGMVPMTAPDGTAILIPAANVDAAISQGARLA